MTRSPRLPGSVVYRRSGAGLARSPPVSMATVARRSASHAPRRAVGRAARRAASRRLSAAPRWRRGGDLHASLRTRPSAFSRVPSAPECWRGRRSSGRGRGRRGDRDVVRGRGGSRGRRWARAPQRARVGAGARAGALERGDRVRSGRGEREADRSGCSEGGHERPGTRIHGYGVRPSPSASRSTVGDVTRVPVEPRQGPVPGDGFTKGQFIDYYTRIAPVAVPHCAAGRYVRAVSGRRRGRVLLEKHCPRIGPTGWATTPVRAATSGDIDFSCPRTCRRWCGDRPTSSRTRRWRARPSRRSRRWSFDLDPGPPATSWSAGVGCSCSDLFDALGLRAFPKTSGSKGLQSTCRSNTPASPTRRRGRSPWLAQLIERHPTRWCRHEQGARGVDVRGLESERRVRRRRSACIRCGPASGPRCPRR